MPGDPDPLYVLARATLLDALDALAEHLGAIVLVGAQAVYHYTGESDIPGAEFTTDADLTIEPKLLSAEPLLADSMTQAGFRRQIQPGSWLSASGVVVDLMVPRLLAGEGRRGARLGVHGYSAARQADGLEASLVDRERAVISSLDAGDPRSREIWIAGPGALVVAKTIKIEERIGSDHRSQDKDALDLFRLLQSISTSDLARRFEILRADPLSAQVTSRALRILPDLFGSAAHPGVVMARRAAGSLGSEEAFVVGDSLVMLVSDLLGELR